MLGAISLRPVAAAGPEGFPPLRPSIEGKVAEILGGEDEIGIEMDDPVPLPGAQLAPSPAKPPFRIEVDLYAIEISAHGTRIVVLDKRTKKRMAFSVSEKMRITSAIVGDNAAACVMHGTGISQLILYNNQFGKWLTFSLPRCERPLRAKIIVGENVACYQLGDRIIAYSIKKDMWSTLVVRAEPAVGDESVVVMTAGKQYVFAAETGTWVTTTAPSAAKR